MPSAATLLWILWLAPLAASALVVLLALRRPGLASALATAGALASLGCSLALLRSALGGATGAATAVPWLEFGRWSAELSLSAPPAALLLLVVVTTVALCVAVFSPAYLGEDPARPRYHAVFSLFLFSMLGLVLADNLIQLFVCWELVGVASYLLVGFWFEKPAAADAARKAFLVNRVGDFALLLGLVMLASATGEVTYHAVAAGWPAGDGGRTTLTALLIFGGVAAKSAQLPLHVWLPDAMEGPTPVSALIHAATMVAAGVYLLCRLSFVFDASAAASAVVATIGAVTALAAALVAVTQTDLKRVLAYSTVSQLGYMVMAAGLGDSTAALFHLSTHAAFKALLFLCAGSVLIALHHHQDLREMGGLRRRLPVTFLAFLTGALALSGVWPLSGFHSKDAILVLAWEHSRPLFVLTAAAAVLTAFYMARCLMLAFLGEPRSEVAAHPHREEGLRVALPLLVLSIASVSAGWHGAIPAFLGAHGGGHLAAHHAPRALHLLLPALPLLGFIPAFLLYRAGGAGDAGLRRSTGPLYRLCERKFGIDEILNGIESVFQGGVAWISGTMERVVFQRAVPASTAFVSGLARRAVSFTQSGNLRAYALVCALGSLVFVLILLAWGGS